MFCLSCLVGFAIFFWGKVWKADLGEISVVSFGSNIGQGMESTHLLQLSRRVCRTFNTKLLLDDEFQLVCMYQVLFYTQFLCGIILVAVFSARMTSTLAVKEIMPVVRSLEDVHQLELNLYINGKVLEIVTVTCVIYFLFLVINRWWKHRKRVQKCSQGNNSQLNMGEPTKQRAEVSCSRS